MIKTVYKLTILMAWLPCPILAQNPIIQTHFTADPAPMVYNDTLYLYTSHDEDSTVNNFFTMYDWRCYSTTDMVNWTDHGAVASLKDFKWHNKTNGAWAPQCIARNGKFYLYVPIHGEGIAVLVSDSPTGPFTDPLGHRLIESDHIWHDIDPTVFIDDDGQAYLFWGNPKLYYVRLNNDMISYNKSIGKDGIVSVEMTKEAFGEKVLKDGKIFTTYTEGPWLYKRNGIYYLLYAASGIPEYIAYSTASSIEGPWTYKGYIMERSPQLAFTNHPALVDYKGKTYFFYHNQDLPGGEGFRRSVCVEEIEFNPDGTLPLIQPTREGIKKAVAYLNPYKRVEAETMAWSSGLKTSGNKQTGIYVSNIENGDYLKLRSVDFLKGPEMIIVSAATASKGGKIEIRLNNPDGELLGIVEINNTGGWQNWKTFTGKLKKVSGVQDLCFVFKGGEGILFNFDWWQLK
ncbi:MAG: glycoside hydrolase family 43 protein [Bacteroidales bacterium]